MNKFINLMINGILLTGILSADDNDNIKTFDYGTSWPQFKYPASFQMDARSFQGEMFKWIAIYKWPEKKLTLEVSPYGFVSDRYKRDEGFDSPRDVVLIYELASARRIKRAGFEIFIEETEEKTNIIFLEDKPEWGNCYNSMVIKYPPGKLKENKALIQALVDSFVPSFILILRRE